VLTSALHTSEVLPGGGCVETILAGCLRARAKAVIEAKARKRAPFLEPGFDSQSIVHHLIHGEASLEWDAMEVFASALEELAAITAPPLAREELLSMTHLANANLGIHTTGVGMWLGPHRGIPGQLELFGWEMGVGGIVPVAKWGLMGPTFVGEVDVGGMLTVADSRVLDFLPSKLQGLHKAVETACRFLGSNLTLVSEYLFEIVDAFSRV